jgi:hypothetical protein
VELRDEPGSGADIAFEFSISSLQAVSSFECSQIIICQVITTYIVKSLQATSFIAVSSPHVQ